MHFPKRNIYLFFPNNFRSAIMLRLIDKFCQKKYIYLSIYKYIYIYVYTSVLVHILRVPYSFSHFGDAGGMFCSLPLFLAPHCGENCLPEFRLLWCSRNFSPAPLTLAWPFAPLKGRNGWRGGRLFSAFSGFSAVCLELGRGSSTLLTLSSWRGWLAEEGRSEGDDICTGGGSLANLWHTSA